MNDKKSKAKRQATLFYLSNDNAKWKILLLTVHRSRKALPRVVELRINTFDMDVTL